MSRDFSPSGLDMIQNFSLENETDDIVAVKITVAERIVDSYGEEDLSRLSDDFGIYPSQIILRPRTTQKVRIQWLGIKSVNSELPYRIIAEQLPVNLKKEQPGTNLTFLMKFVGTLYVIPADNPQPSPEVVRVGVSEDQNELTVEVENRGRLKMLMEHFSLELAGGNSKVVIPGEDLPGLYKENLLSGDTRIINIKTPSGLDLKNVSGKILIKE